mmetsp:Transcript_13667/g.41296  ORF Transcript_13667/g.41296 Transcript_13667/m.41296 type:complete len:175 (+) Transcript_13667:124-648(+)
MADQATEIATSSSEPAAAQAPKISPLPDHLKMRQLEEGDREKGFLELLEQLTVVQPVTGAAWSETFSSISGHPDYHVVVIEDTTQERLVGAATVFFERKFIRGCGLVGHIEDVVVDSNCRGARLGQRLITALMAEAEKRGCYKTILDCSEENVPFYKKCNLEVKGVQMAQYHKK